MPARNFRLDRRDFLLAGAALACGPLASAQVRTRGAISLVIDSSNPVSSAAPVQWAASELQQALTDAGFTVRRADRPQRAENQLSIVASGNLALQPEGIRLATTGSTILVQGGDPRGLVYALLELADRVRLQPGTALKISTPIVESPANPVRSVMRQFTSELLDKPWFYDREMWPRYLTMLATHRFNRFHLAFGFGYDSLHNVADSYLLFLYPFLLSVPGYNVRAANLPDSERGRNLDMLRFISAETAARGIDFQLGIWTHGYRWPTSPRAQNTIEGLTDETHATYCRDALTAVLQACPAISSVALRIHGESGVPEGSYDFWKTVFDGVTRCGRKVEIDLHAKGIDTTMIANALSTGMPVNVSPKYWAEHLGMPYHQAAIRELEMPVPGRSGAGLMTLSEGSRIATRYGYADLLRDDRQYSIRHRVFSGTQRLLLWGDPISAAAYSRAFQFCGSTGADLMEPLTCRGRRGSAVPGARTGYADPRLEPHWDWQKYAYWYRVWGRLMYNPDTGSEVWLRQFGGAGSKPLASALANASRILPIVTTTHAPSAACDAYWPEIYWNQPMMGEPAGNPYGDTPSPKVFQNVSPLDPQLFSRIADFAGDLLQGKRSGKYSPIEVAQWLEDFAGAAEKNLLQAGQPDSVEFRRAAIDVAIAAGLGRFFAAKFRSGVLYAIHERTGDRRALEEALKAYRAARFTWAELARRAKGVYAADLSVSDRFDERGQWLDRLPQIDEDIARMERQLASSKPGADPRVTAAIAEVVGRPHREPARCTHQPPAGFRPKESVVIEIAVQRSRKPISARLYYRHVNQAERYQSTEMQASDNVYRAVIPAEYTASPYPLAYYFEFKEAPAKAWLYPGFAADLANQPYFILRRS
ncbi:MAG: glycoside hydrolase family 20 zincin-like fold domain-containing protein [Bryobacteraceae bacterium]|jgi:hypothetical protein